MKAPEPMMGASSSNRRSLGEGVYYAPVDYAGIVRRLLIMMIDSAILYFAAIVLAFVWFVLKPDMLAHPLWYHLSCGAMCYLYLVVLKRTRIRTLGYIVTGTKVVNLRGERPSLAQMTFRLLALVIMSCIAPLHLLADILWPGAEESKQTGRDKLVGTYVIKKDARPIGRGRQRLVLYLALCLACMVPEVYRPPDKLLNKALPQVGNLREGK